MSAQPAATAAQSSVKKDPLTLYEERAAKRRATNTNSELVKKQLIQKLTGIKASTSASAASTSQAVFEVLPNAVNPGLFVNNVGHVRLPITKLDADKIKAQTGYGLSGDGITIESSSKTPGELKSCDFSLSNPMWQMQMECVVDKVKSGLGIAASPDEIRVTLHKLMCLGKDDFIASNTEYVVTSSGLLNQTCADIGRLAGNTESHFVTLAICLPSPHTGGDIHVTHSDSLEVHKMSEAAEFGFSFAAW